MDPYIFLMVVGAIGIYVIFRIRKKDSLFKGQKILFSSKYHVVINPADTFCNAEESFVYKNGMFQSDAVLIEKNVYWQDIEISHSSLGGSQTYKFDALFFAAVKNLEIVCISKEINFRLRAIKNNTDIFSDTLKDFLVSNSLSIDSGSWGAVLVKNEGPFFADEVKNLVKIFIDEASSKVLN